MIITFGKFKGKSVEYVVLKEPEYTWWVLTKRDAEGPLAAVQRDVRRLIRIFNSKQFVKKCMGCGRTAATRFSLAPPSPIPYWWCERCDARSMGVIGPLDVGKTYEEAMEYATRYLSRNNLVKDLIRDIAVARGLPKRVGEKEAAAFFGKA